MALQLITGVSGSGKSTMAFDMVIRAAAEDRNRNVFVLVPDQFSQEATRTLVEKNNGGILNIDVLSFRRLAFRALEEYEGDTRTILTDEGKIMLLRKVIGEHKNELKFFKKGLDNPGFLDECKSLLSEFIEYGIGDDEIEEVISEVGEQSRLGMKLRDLRLLHMEMEDRMGEIYRMADELIPMLTEMVPRVSCLEDATICLDGFTGFTPVQYELIRALLIRCRDVIVTVTTDRDDKRQEIFRLSLDTIERLTQIAGEVAVGVNEIITDGFGAGHGSYRLKDNPVLSFLEEHVFTYDGEICETGADELSALQLRVCRSEREEAAFAARETAALIREGVRPEEIAVVTGDMERYEPYLRRAFLTMGVPFFLDQKKSLGTNPLAEYIVSFLTMHTRGYERTDVVRFLRNSLSPLGRDNVDRLENYLLANGKRGYQAYTEKWTVDVRDNGRQQASAPKTLPNGTPIKTTLDYLNESRQKFIDKIEKPVGQLKNKATVREYSEVLCQMMIDNKLRFRLECQADTREENGDRILANEYRKIYPAILSVFDTLVDLLGEEEVSIREYRDILTAGISEGVMGFVPPSGGQVLIGDLERSRIGEIRYLFFLGNVDTIFPKKAGVKGILTDREREQLDEIGGRCGFELAPSADQLYYRELFYLYRVLSHPSERLYLTFIKMDTKGESARVSYLIEHVRKLFHEKDSGKNGIEVIDDEEDTGAEAILGIDRGRSFLLRMNDGGASLVWETLREYHEENKGGRSGAWLDEPPEINKADAGLDDGIPEALYSSTIKGSVTRFETFAGCPYRFFLQYGLRLNERYDFRVSSADRGTVIHNAMHNLYNKMTASGVTWRTVGEDDLKKLGGDAFDEEGKLYCDDKFHQSMRTSYKLKRMRRIFLNTIGYMRSQMKAGDFDQAESEWTFDETIAPSVTKIPLDNQREISLTGRVDRIDRCVDDGTTFVKILDYKNSSRELDLSKVYYSLELQLLTYLKVELQRIEDAGGTAVPAAVLFQAVEQNELKWKKDYDTAGAAADDSKKNAVPKGYVNGDNDYYQHLDNSLKKDGDSHKSEVIPVSITQKNEFGRGSRVLFGADFDMLTDYVHHKIELIGEEIYNGVICARTYQLGQENGCKYCPYAGICGKEERTSSNMTRDLEQINNLDPFWLAMGDMGEEVIEEEDA